MTGIGPIAKAAALARQPECRESCRQLAAVRLELLRRFAGRCLRVSIAISSDCHR